MMLGRLHRLDATWIVLIGLAVATIIIHLFVKHALTANTAVLVLAIIKGRRIVLDYLDLRNAPALWRGLVTGWIILVASLAWGVSAITQLI